MPRPAFYNDNEYRAYPFIFDADSAGLPPATIVDAGVIMRLDANYDETQHTVWLHEITRSGDDFSFTFKSNAFETGGPTLTFSRNLADDIWAAEYADSDSLDICAAATNDPDPAWTGFLVTGRLDDLAATMATLGATTLTFNENEYQLEPARIQNLADGYVRSLNVGNYRRVYVPNCCKPVCCTGDALYDIPIVLADNTERDALQGADANRLVLTTDNGRFWRRSLVSGAYIWEDISIVVNATCLRGDIRFVPGYNCEITQTTRLNEIIVSAAVGAGDPDTTELCENGGELPFYDGELTPLLSDETRSKFLSGGPACNELIFTINGVGGKVVTFASGNGVNIITNPETNKITIERDTSLAYGNCQTPPA